jgi:uncharacterized protein
MKLHEQHQAHQNLISRYGAGEIVINGQRYTTPCIVAPGVIQPAWIASLEELTPGTLQAIWSLQPRIVLLGSVAASAVRQRALRPVLLARQVALEAMDLGAACRTYNVLAQEDRAVAALLFP